MENIQEQENLTEVNDVSQEETLKTDEVKKISFSNGIEFTPEELANLSPDFLKKIQQLKTGDKEFSKGINKIKEEKTFLQKEIDAMKENLKTSKKDIKKPNLNSNVQSQEPYNSDLEYQTKWIKIQITKDKLQKAKERAEGLYGEEVVNWIITKISDELSILISEGARHTNFDNLFNLTFSHEMTRNQEIRDLFHKFKSPQKQPEQLEEEKIQKKIKQAELKQNVTTGLPPGGTSGVIVNEQIEKPNNIKQSIAKAKEMFNNYNKK